MSTSGDRARSDRDANALAPSSARSSARRPAAIGAVVWIAVVLALRPHPYDDGWARAILCFAPAVLLPLWTGGPAPLLDELLRRAIPRPSVRAAWWFVAVFGVGASQGIDVSRGDAARALGVASLLPWSAFVARVAWCAAREIVGRVFAWREGVRSDGSLGPDEVGQLAAPLFAVIGVAWAVFDRAGVRPLDLPSEIVLLTAIHFHFAGAVLPLVAAWAERGRRGARAWLGVIAAVTGVPLVAGGITATQLGAPPVVESCAATIMAAGGAWVAGRVAARGRRGDRTSRALTATAAACLAVGMALAVAYAWRAHLDLAWMGIPAMRGWHGTLNGIGFGPAATLAARRSPV